jgi:hypothetical protein
MPDVEYLAAHAGASTYLLPSGMIRPVRPARDMTSTTNLCSTRGPMQGAYAFLRGGECTTWDHARLGGMLDLGATLGFKAAQTR